MSDEPKQDESGATEQAVNTATDSAGDAVSKVTEIITTAAEGAEAGVSEAASDAAETVVEAVRDVAEGGVPCVVARRRSGFSPHAEHDVGPHTSPLPQPGGRRAQVNATWALLRGAFRTDIQRVD